MANVDPAANVPEFPQEVAEQIVSAKRTYNQKGDVLKNVAELEAQYPNINDMPANVRQEYNRYKSVANNIQNLPNNVKILNDYFADLQNRFGGQWDAAFDSFYNNELNFLKDLKGAVVVNNILYTHGSPVLGVNSLAELDQAYENEFARMLQRGIENNAPPNMGDLHKVFNYARSTARENEDAMRQTYNAIGIDHIVVGHQAAGTIRRAAPGSMLIVQDLGMTKTGKGGGLVVDLETGMIANQGTREQENMLPEIAAGEVFKIDPSIEQEKTRLGERQNAIARDIAAKIAQQVKLGYEVTSTFDMFINMVPSVRADVQNQLKGIKPKGWTDPQIAALDNIINIRPCSSPCITWEGVRIQLIEQIRDAAQSDLPVEQFAAQNPDLVNNVLKSVWGSLAALMEQPN